MKNKKQFKSKWSASDLLSSLDEFNKLYASRPIKENKGGMTSPHMFPAWFVIKHLKPKHLIESGVFKGLGTWFFEQASPSSELICIDPSPEARQYSSQSASYQTQDFLFSDWSRLSPADTVVFFDDHQNCLDRIKRAHQLGFKKIIIEDNYPIQQGDCYSPKKILSKKDYVIDKKGQRLWHAHNPQDYEFLLATIKIYQEMPPIFKTSTTRWGEPWDDLYPTPPPLLSASQQDKYPLFFKESLSYTWLCYIELQ